MSNELVDLVLMHGRDEGLFRLSIADLRVRYLAADFSTPSWLPLYEIERRAWDRSPAFTKLGQADDANGLYEQLKTNNVEFYMTEPQFYTVEAFEGWNLSQANFAEQTHFTDDHDHYGNFDEEPEYYE